MVVRDFDILQANALLAVIQHMRKLMEEREPHGFALFKAVVK